MHNNQTIRRDNMKLRYFVAAAFFTTIAFPALANDDMAKYQDDARKVVK